MIQYLYAAYSLGGPQVPEKHRDMVRRWREVILGIAKEEMGHLISVQNVLKLIGAAQLRAGRFSLGQRLLSFSILSPTTHAQVPCLLRLRRSPA